MNLESLTPNIDHSIVNLFNQYFHSAFHDPPSFLSRDDLSSIHDSLSSITITAPDVFEALVSLDAKKSPGMDKISSRVLQSFAKALTEPLLHLFSHSLRYATLPTSWKLHKIVSVPKAGDPYNTQSRTIIPFHCYPTHQKSLNGYNL